MSLCIYPIFEQPLDLQMETTGETIAQYYEELEELAERLDVRPLSYFDSISHDKKLLKALETYKGDPTNLINKTHKEIWFPAEEGIETLTILINYVKKNLDKKNTFQEVLTDLEDLQKALTTASQKPTKFQLKIG